MNATLPNDRSVIRLPEGLRLQTGLQAETLCVKRLRALKWLKTERSNIRLARLRLARLQVVS
jgi:hypothetical protein